MPSNSTRYIKDILWGLVFFGVLAVIFRMTHGLGAVTNLTDAVPWGLWKIFNMVAGVALSTSGFTIGFLVIVLKLERFRPLLKPAILIAFLGYGASVTALFFDIGLPLRIWHAVVMWNPRSFLFEVAMCVMCYFTITILEMLPTVTERSRFARIGHLLHRVSPGIVMVGIALSSLHHSSLGSLFLVTPTRLHPIWYTPLLPVLFILSAIGAGMMMAVLVRVLFARFYETSKTDAREDDASPLKMVSRLSLIAASVLFVYLCVDLANFFTSPALASALRGDWETALYVAELLFLCIVPIAVIAHPKGRGSLAGLGVASGSAVSGLLLNRLNVGIFGYFRDAKAVYLPSLAEWALSLGIIAAAMLVFFFIIENFAVFDAEKSLKQKFGVRFNPLFDRVTGVWQATLSNGLERISFVAVIAIPLAFGLLYPPYLSAANHVPAPVSPPLSTDPMRHILKIDGNRKRELTVFNHRDHQDRLGKKASCVKCHHLSLPNDTATPCARCHRDMTESTNIFAHEKHFAYVARSEKLSGLRPENHSCPVCHAASLPKSAKSAKPCLSCHEKDMKPASTPEKPFDSASAVGYRDAMHGTCVPCHEKSGAEKGRPALSECTTCHKR